MKKLILSVLCVLSYNIYAQDWFDKSCDNIDDTVIQEEFKTENDRNIIKIIVNQAGDIEINGVEKSDLTEIEFKEYILDFVTNPNASKDKAVKPEKVIFQTGSFQKGSKKIDKYTNYVYDVYLYLWDKASQTKYKSTYLDLNCKKREKIFNSFPLKIIGGLDKKENKTKQKRKGIGVPTFGGDAIKN